MIILTTRDLWLNTHVGPLLVDMLQSEELGLKGRRGEELFRKARVFGS